MAPELVVSPGGRRYGALRPKPDARNFGLHSVPFVIPKALPTTYDLTSFLGPVKNQGDLGACTAFAGTGMLEFLFRKHKGQTPVFSPKFLYYQERVLDGDVTQGDVGSTGQSAVTVMQKQGVCLETEDPYDVSTYNVAPTTEQVAEALQYTAGAYHSISNVWDLKSCIASDYAAIIGFVVYDSFESAAVASSGLMPMPNFSQESVLGGHEVLFKGYNDTIQCPGCNPGAFSVRNSWGTGWGLTGDFWFPYDAVANTNVFMDAKIQHFGPAWGEQAKAA